MTGPRAPDPEGPLSGLIVLDLTRMLPGAVLAHELLELGARVIKVEAPAGDPFRHAPPLAEGTGAGFAALYRGAESLVLDLREAGDAGRLRRLARHADVLAESFRPGTLDRWGVAPTRLRAANPALVVCSIPAYDPAGPRHDESAHDLNLLASSGLLELLGAIPRIQLVDVTAGLLAAGAVMAALLSRHRTRRGTHIQQPLESAVLPHLAWPAADLASGGPGLWNSLLAGHAPSYRLYTCADGLQVALAALEPKFWSALVEAMGLPDLAGSGLDTGPEGAAAAARIAAAFASRSREDWLALAAREGLPISAVRSAVPPPARPVVTPPASPSHWFPSLAALPAIAAPGIGEHTAAILAEFGLD